ncbi:hypothetical protein [Methanobacterium spitsbergense]|uniref:Uncharacterized protein n=1 Tax=Methanobacterium spitsbergense TaxID=2874285 RepID=A0A8T5UVC1_9EURY|nr:hypothetical protein [Methanobacterium spitsbergense]MBZ2164823.1 hypothetical protein [Methanobacterium spitsbergense]
MGLLNDVTVRMRYIALVKKGLISDVECNSYTKKIEIDPCIHKKVSQFDEYFVPGTVLLSERASYKLRIEYPVE